MSSTHTVKSGDSLSKIAAQQGLTLAQLLAANPAFTAGGRNPNLIHPGEKINIPGPTSSPNKPAGKPVQPCPEPPKPPKPPKEEKKKADVSDLPKLNKANPPLPASSPTGCDYVKVIDAGSGWTKVQGADGIIYLVKGDRNWRNNNPGNIEYGDFAKKMGAIGTDGRFAVFPNLEAGNKAREYLMFESKSYKNLSIAEAIERYAPQSENDTEKYIRQVASAAGVSRDTIMSDLTQEQREKFISAQNRIEGMKTGQVSIFEKPSDNAPLIDRRNSDYNPKLDIKAACGHLTTSAEAKPTGWCAKYVRQALEAGGMSTEGRPTHAKDYGPFLKKKGFVEYGSNEYDVKNPQAGDIVVIAANKTSPDSGHIAMYDGTQWVSDFKQRDFWGGSARSLDPQPQHKFYRLP